MYMRLTLPASAQLGFSSPSSIHFLGIDTAKLGNSPELTKENVGKIYSEGQKAQKGSFFIVKEVKEVRYSLQKKRRKNERKESNKESKGRKVVAAA